MLSAFCLRLQWMILQCFVSRLGVTVHAGAFIYHRNKTGQLSGKTLRGTTTNGLLVKKNLIELLELYIHNTTEKRREALVKTDQRLIHTHEIVPVV